MQTDVRQSIDATKVVSDFMGHGAGGRCSAAPTVAILESITEHSPGYVELYAAAITKLAQKLTRDHFLLVGTSQRIIANTGGFGDGNASTQKLAATPSMAVMEEILNGSAAVDNTPDDAMMTLISCLRLLGKHDWLYIHGRIASKS